MRQNRPHRLGIAVDKDRWALDFQRYDRASRKIEDRLVKKLEDHMEGYS
jgi:hypothetical protein